MSNGINKREDTMALFNETLAHEITALIRQRQAALTTALDSAPNQLQADLRLLIEIANGVHVRSEELIPAVDQALRRVLDLLLGSALQSAPVYPDDFWERDIGILVSRARWWIHGDDLITISNAAALAFGANNQANRMRIARAIDKGMLDWVPDPSVLNPQQNRRVLRQQVERLRDLSTLPE